VGAWVSAVGSGRGRARVSQSCDPVDHDREDHARGVEQPYPSATFPGPAEILTKDIGERTARITQRIAGMDEPPTPRATKRWLKSTAESETQPVRCTSLALMIRFDEITEAFTE
jgi:hypothetical protein